MSNPSKQKGTAAETAVVGYLRSRGWLHAERRAHHGNTDKGDLTGIPGVCVEIKDHKVSSQSFPAYIDEAEAEKRNANAEVGVAWVKRRGTTDPGRWIVAMTGEQFTDLLKAAGW
jgi:hypothetical protein